MAQYITTATAEARRHITCYFKCHKCAKNVSVSIPLIETVTLETNNRRVFGGFPEDVRKFEKSVQKEADLKLKKRLDKIGKMSFVKKCGQIGANGKCPVCGDIQPWSMPKPMPIALVVVIFLFIGFVIMVIMGFVGRFYYEKGLLLILPPVIMSIIGLVIGIFKERKYNKKMNIAIKELEKVPESERPKFIVPEMM